MRMTDRDSWLPQIAGLVFVLSLLTYIATLSAYGSWLDGGEFVASAATLGVTHPPGHPLQSLWSGLFTLLPVGTLAFRVSLASAVAAAFGCSMLFLLTVRLLGASSLGHAWRLALAGVTSVSFSWMPSLWSQATRPEVYALQFMLSMVVCERLVVALQVQQNRDGEGGRAERALFTAAFVWGLSLCNHHFLALLLLPAAVLALHQVAFGVGLRCVGFTLLGLLPYVYLPLRALRGPTPNFGQPTSLSRVFWVVSAQAFHKNTGHQVPEPAAKRVLDVLAVYDENISIVGLLLALGCMFLLVRRADSRRTALMLGSVILLSILARSWLGHTAANPDAEGYLVLGIALSTAFIALFVGFILQVVTASLQSGRAKRLVVSGVLLALFAVGGFRARNHLHAQDRIAFADTDSFDDVAFRRAPRHAILILHDPETIFRALEYIVEYQVPARELLVVPTPFLAYPGMIETLVSEEPLLQQALTHYALDGQWDASQLQSLASSRTLLIEMDPFLPSAVIHTLIPNAFFFEVLSSEAYPEDRQAALSQHEQGHEHLQRLLGAQPRYPKTRDRLLLHHYQDALYFAAVGQADAAKEAVVHGLSLNPHAQELRALDRALELHEGPIDIAPFLPPNAR